MTKRGKRTPVQFGDPVGAEEAPHPEEQRGTCAADDVGRLLGGVTGVDRDQHRTGVLMPRQATQCQVLGDHSATRSPGRTPRPMMAAAARRTSPRAVRRRSCGGPRSRPLRGRRSRTPSGRAPPASSTGPSSRCSSGWECLVMSARPPKQVLGRLAYRGGCRGVPGGGPRMARRQSWSVISPHSRPPGGPGREHEAFEERLAWNRHLAAAGLTCLAGRSSTADGDSRSRTGWRSTRRRPRRRPGQGQPPRRGTGRPDADRLRDTRAAERFLPAIRDVTELWCQGYPSPARAATWPT